MGLPAEELTGLRDALVRARASGVRVTLYEGKRVEYATDAEMARAIADLERRLVQLSAPKRGGMITPITSKGL